MTLVFLCDNVTVTNVYSDTDVQFINGHALEKLVAAPATIRTQRSDMINFFKLVVRGHLAPQRVVWTFDKLMQLASRLRLSRAFVTKSTKYMICDSYGNYEPNAHLLAKWGKL